MWRLSLQFFFYFHFNSVLPLLRAFKWGIQLLSSSTGIEMASRQSLNVNFSCDLCSKSDVFFTLETLTARHFYTCWARTLWLFLKSNARKNKQFLILIPRHPRRCGDVRKLEKNLFGWGLFEKTEIYPLNEAKSWILQSLRHFLNKVVNWIFQSAWKEVV